MRDVHYARSGDVAIAYQTVGAGSVDVIFARGFAGDLLSVWEQPLITRFIEEVASFARLTIVDKRGTGLSDRVEGVPTLETRMDDLRAVMDDIGSEEAILWTAQEGARLATLFAATYPERTAGLVLFDPTAKGRRTPDYPWGLTDEEWRAWLDEVGDGWGRTDFLERRLAEWAPSMQHDPEFRTWFLAHMRRGLSPGSALAFFRMVMESDVSEVLPSVRVPTVVLSSEAERGPGTYFAQQIPGARLVELPSSLRSIYHWIDDEAHEIAMRETRKLAAVEAPVARSDRVLATVVFTDIVGSTERARSSATVPGVCCSNAITRSFAGESRSSGARRSIRPETASSPRSTGRDARSSARARWLGMCAGWVWSFGSGSTPASASATTAS